MPRTINYVTKLGFPKRSEPNDRNLAGGFYTKATILVRRMDASLMLVFTYDNRVVSTSIENTVLLSHYFYYRSIWSGDYRYVS